MSERNGVCRDAVESSIRFVSLEEDRGDREVSQRTRPQGLWCGRSCGKTGIFIPLHREDKRSRLIWVEKQTAHWEERTCYSDWSHLNCKAKPRPVRLSVHMREIKGGIRLRFELPLKEFSSLLSLAVGEEKRSHCRRVKRKSGGFWADEIQ